MTNTATSTDIINAHAAAAEQREADLALVNVDREFALRIGHTAEDIAAAEARLATPAGLIHCTSPDHEGVQRPGNGFFYVPERERPTYCTDCAAIATAPRTPELVALEVALAKAHYCDSATLEEQNARFGRLVALEDELAGLDAETERDTLPHPDRCEER